MWDNINAKDRPAIAAELGVNMVPNQRDTLPKLYNEETRNRIVQWLDEQERANGKPGVSPTTLKELKDPTTYGSWSPEAHQIWERAEDAIGNATASPWRSQDVPPLAEWLDANKERIDLLVEASARPRFFMPSAELLDPSNTEAILLLGPFQNVREAARVLTTRAMLHAGEGQYEAAWQDILAVYRWARLIGQGGTLVDQLVAAAINGMAVESTLVLLGTEQVPEPLLQQIQAAHDSFIPAVNLADTYANGERLFGLAMLLPVANSNSAVELLSPYGGGSTPTPLNALSIDWNIILSQYNDWLDRLAATARIADPVARGKALVQNQADIVEIESSINHPLRWLGAAFSRTQRSRLIGDKALLLWLPSFEATERASNREATNLALLRIAVALALYQAANNEYPAGINQLVPQFIAKLPNDSFSNKPFLYRRTTDGYLLYSVGENGVDEQGNQEFSFFEGQRLYTLPDQQADQLRAKIPPGSDDVSIRIPCQPFQIPPPQSPASN